MHSSAFCMLGSRTSNTGFPSRSNGDLSMMGVYYQFMPSRKRLARDSGSILKGPPKGVAICTFTRQPIKSEDFNRVPIDISVFRRAVDKFLDAVVAEPPPPPKDSGAFGIMLMEPLGSTLVGGYSLSEWYEKRLTTDQRRFVDHDLQTPVRLKGAAGTGKTLSMAVKCLRDVYKFEDQGFAKRVAFLTHSVALAQDVLPGMFSTWPAPGSEDTELGVLMEPEVGHGETEVYSRVQA